jgi:hypothetical protein
LIYNGSTRPAIHVRIQESEFHYFDSLNALPEGNSDASIPRTLSMTVDQLSRVLRTAGIDIRKLNRSADNAMRLAAMARLVETLEPYQSQAAKRRNVAGLPKWRLVRVLKYIDAKLASPSRWRILRQRPV